MCKRYSEPEIQAFCSAYISAGNGATFSGAYRLAFPDESVSLSESQINRRASRLFNSDRCQRELERLRRPVAEKTEYTLERFVGRMISLSQEAQSAGEYPSAISAEVHAAKALGIYSEKQQLDVSGTLSVSALLGDLASRLGDDA